MLAISPTHRVFVLSGAGVSAESGIPTFRGVRGLWRNYRIEEVASPHARHRDPRLVWEFYSMRRKIAASAKPNPAHVALAKLEQKLQGHLFLCTQNVDDLHEQAGSRHVIHMHGDLFKSRCDSCSRPPFHDTSPYDPQAELPRCECGGGIRPHICWFGEVPFELDRIFCALDECTIFMAIGTSGWSSPQPVSSPMSVAGRGPFMSGRKSPRMPPRLRNVIWAKRARCCLTCSARCDPGKVLTGC